MQMLDLLAAIGSHVGQGPIATVLDTYLIGHVHYELKEGLALAPASTVEIVQGDDVLSRDHQYVLGSLRVEIAESNEESVFENDGAGDLPTGDPTKCAVVHGG